MPARLLFGPVLKELQRVYRKLQKVLDDHDLLRNEFSMTISKKDKRLLDQAEIARLKKKNRISSARQLPGWITLDASDKSIREIIENAMVERTDVFTGDWFASPTCIEAYAYRFLPPA